MATRTAVRTNTDHGVVFTWTGLLTSDVGSAVELPGYADICVQFGGTEGTGGKVTLKGSNDGTNYIGLTDPQGNAIDEAPGVIEQVLEGPRYIRPETSAGDGSTNMTVILFARRTIR